MRLLLDSHVLVWAATASVRLSSAARDLLEAPASELHWSAASTWELAIKVSLGKLALPLPVGEYVAARLFTRGVRPLPIGHEHAAAVQALPLHHRDPFDRMLVAQARHEGLTLLSDDAALRRYDVAVIW